MTLKPTRLSLAILAVLFPSLSMTAAAATYPSIDLSSPNGESMLLDPGDTVVNRQVAPAILISGAGNALAGDRVSIESGIADTGVGATGITLRSGGTLDLSNSTINTQGYRNAQGVVVQDAGSKAVLNGNTITTEGQESHGVYAREGGQAEVTGGTISARGYGAHGLNSAGAGSTITAQGLEITAWGAEAAAVNAEDGGSIVLDKARLNANDTATQWGSRGIMINRGSVTATHTDIRTLRGRGIETSGGTLSLSQSTIDAYSSGVHLGSASGASITQSTAKLTDVKIHSEAGYGLNAQSESRATLERVQIDSNGSQVSGIWLPSKAVVSVKDSTIEMTGANGVGVDNRAGTFTMDGGSITTHGTSGHGLYSSEAWTGSGGRATSTLRNVAIETFGQAAIGVVSRTAVSDIAFEGGSVTTHGKTAYGMLVNGGRLQATGTTVRTTGDFATGLRMGNSGATVTLDGVDMRTSGTGAAGLMAYSMKAGVDNEVTIRNSHIETEDGHGITVEGSGLTANLVDSMVIGKSRNGGNGTLLQQDEWTGSDNAKLNIAARNVQLNALRSRLEGDVAIDSGSASLSLQDHSMLTGALLDRNGRTVDKLSIDDSSVWRVRGNSAVADLDTTGSVSFDTPGSDFKTLDISGNLKGGGLFEMRTDIGSGQGDLLRVAGTVEGNHRVLVANSGTEPATANGALKLIQTEGGPGSFSLANRGQVVDVGTYRYELKRDDSAGGRPTDWRLLNTGRNAPVEPPAIIPPPVTPPPVEPPPVLPPPVPPLPVDPPPVTPPGPDKPRPEHLSTAANAAINTSAASTAQAIWHAVSGTLARRMGELRQGKDQDGLWIRSFGERQKLDNHGARAFEQTVSGMQIGADKSLPVEDGRWYIGGIAGYSSADRHFSGDGSGSANSYHLGAYTTWLADSGWYVDGVLKANRIQQDFKVEATDGQRVKGKTSQNAIGATLEAGRQLQLGEGWFVEPQAGMAVVHVNGDNYRASNGLDVSAGAGNSLQLRAGSALGRRIELANADFIQPYVKVGRAQEFNGKSTVRTNGIATRTDLSGGRTELGLGIAAALGASHRVYADYEYANGSKLDKPWSVSAGYRYTW